MVGGDLIFLSVVVRYPGSFTDSRDLSYSNLFQPTENDAILNVSGIIENK